VLRLFGPPASALGNALRVSRIAMRLTLASLARLRSSSLCARNADFGSNPPFSTNKKGCQTAPTRRMGDSPSARKRPVCSLRAASAPNRTIHGAVTSRLAQMIASREVGAPVRIPHSPPTKRAAFRQPLSRWRMGDSNPRPIDCEPIALPTELIPQKAGSI
jgi:hypothetical protein